MKNCLRVAALVVVFFVAYGLIGAISTAKACNKVAVSFNNATHVLTQSLAEEPNEPNDPNAPKDPNKSEVTDKGGKEPNDPNAPKDPNKVK